MNTIINLAGQRFGRLLVLSYAARNDGRKAWLCRCDCGSELEVPGGNLRGSRTSSCGCLRAEQMVVRGIKHGKYWSRAYRAWTAMRNRCNCKTNKNYVRYGARGITVCERWGSFENFYEDMGDPPAGMSIDRINNDGNYEPSNCRWATLQQQQRNRSISRLCQYQGQTVTLRELSSLCGVSYHALRHRIFVRGISVENAVMTQTSRSWK